VSGFELKDVDFENHQIIVRDGKGGKRQGNGFAKDHTGRFAISSKGGSKAI